MTGETSQLWQLVYYGRSMFVGVKISIKVRCLCDVDVAEIVLSWFCAAEDSVP